MGGTPCDKRSTYKWVLSFGLDGRQRSDGSHQWKMAKMLLRLKKKLSSCPFCLMSFMFPFSLSDYVIRQDCNVLLIVCNEEV